MKKWLYRLLRIGPNLYSFFSGVLISIAVNLYTSILSPSRLQEVLLPLVSGLFFFVAGCFAMVLAWELEEINRIALTKRPEFLTDSDQTLDVWTVIVDSRLASFSVYVLISVVCSMIAIALLAIPLLLLILETVAGLLVW